MTRFLLVKKFEMKKSQKTPNGSSLTISFFLSAILPHVAMPITISLLNSSETASPTKRITPVFVPPVMIQAFVLVAALIRPRLNAVFMRCGIVKFCAPPVTLIINWGTGRFQLRSWYKYCIMSSGRVSSDIRMYCKIKPKMHRRWGWRAFDRLLPALFLYRIQETRSCRMRQWLLWLYSLWWSIRWPRKCGRRQLFSLCIHHTCHLLKDHDDHEHNKRSTGSTYSLFLSTAVWHTRFL